ncbi:KCNB1 [Symbiodinium natans]|uniref:KCNB1 protein n=1 Tax=Symbiodinium natans TaxID=878477 RepID=A0A812RTU2_9DINO|nr:KCNB1 [Symbiodinium natans]
MGRRPSHMSNESSAAPSSAESSDRTPGHEDENAQTSTPYRGRSRQMLPVRSMDLKVAWKLHAKEVTRELGTLSAADKRIQPLLRLVYRSRLDYVWELLDDPASSRWAWRVSQFLKMLVIFSVLISNLETTKPPMLDRNLVVVLQISFDAVFLVEFLCRILSAPSKRSYLRDPLNWADMLSGLGLPLRASVGFGIEGLGRVGWGMETIQLILLYFLPLARLLKLLRYFDSLRLLIDACVNSAEALPVLAYMLAVMVLFSATIIYLVESEDNIPTLQHALWLAIVTVTTVGYGDYFPKSPWGYLCVSVLTFISVLFLALPVGIVGHEFTQSWLSRRRVILQTRVRRCLNKWGYTAGDLQMLFEYADADGDGSLALVEFIELVRQMRIGVSAEAAAELFTMFDSDQNGTLDRTEVLRHLFPDEYVREKHLMHQASLEVSKHRIGQALDQWGSSRLSADDPMKPPVEPPVVEPQPSDGPLESQIDMPVFVGRDEPDPVCEQTV